VNKKIHTGSFDFRLTLDDVEGLNKAALQGLPDISKVSFGVWPLLADQYELLTAGGALGKGVGPLLITKDKDLHVLPEDMAVAIPGEHTTANLLFSFAFPGHIKKRFMRYDLIEEFVRSGKGAGVIIHENRFTYKQKGLHKMLDLGSFWQKETQSAIPLGGIVIKKTFSPEVKQQINQLIIQSIQYAQSKYPQLNSFITSNAREMSTKIMRRHIDLYVNEFSLDPGLSGTSAIQTLEKVHQSMFGS
jgi:1,4-dihydroxy-6-naphthoate synthase